MILKQVSVVTFFTGINLLATFLNQLVLAYLFGAGVSMDAFLAAGAVPFAVLNMAIGDMSYALVPLLIQHEKIEDLQEVVNSCFTVVCLLSLAVATFGAVCHRLILHLTTAADMPSATFELAASISPVIWVIMGLTIVGSFLTGVHHYHRSFTLPSMTLSTPYVGMILGGLAGASHYGISSVVVGWALGTLARNLILVARLPSSSIRFSGSLAHPAVRKLLRALLPLGISLMPFTVLPMIDVFWASRLPIGSISYLGYSNRIVIALTGVVVQGISVVLFPHLSELLAGGQFAAFHTRAMDALKAIFLVIVPLTIAVAVLRIPLLNILLVRGRFTSAAAQGVAFVLPLYLLGTIWMALMNIISRGFYALRNYVTPAITGVGALVLYISLSGLLIQHLSYIGIGLAYAVFWILIFFLQTYLLGKRVGALLVPELFSFFLKVLLSSVVAGLILDWLAGPAIALIGLLPGLLIVFAATACLYFALTHFVFRVPQYRMLFAAFARR